MDILTAVANLERTMGDLHREVDTTIEHLEGDVPLMEASPQGPGVVTRLESLVEEGYELVKKLHRVNSNFDSKDGDKPTKSPVRG